MKTNLSLIIAFLFATICSFSQDKKSMEIGAGKIYQSTVKSDFDGILDFTYPKVFDMVSREQMKEVLIATFTGNGQMKVELLPVEPKFKFGDLKKIDNQTFCLIDHNLSMKLIITEKIADDEKEMMTDLLKGTMETEEVTFNKEENSFIISKKATMIAISDASTNNEWRFINRDKKNILAKKLFSEKVLKELGL